VEQIDTGPARYDATTMLLHWVTAIMVVALWVGASTLDWLPRGPLRADARSLHVALGLALGALVGGRLAWRLSWGKPLPAVEAGPFAAAAIAAHRGLYALMGAMVLVGIVLVSTTGDTAFNHFHIDPLAPADRALADQLRRTHAAIGWAIVALAGVHSAAAIYHQYVLRDDLLTRMLPRRR
jgi:cytochrome b561